MQYTIIVDKQSRANPSSDKKTYTIEVEELRTNGNVSDSLVITKDDDYVLRKLKLTEFNVLEELSEPVKEPLDDLNIKLFEGDNYIYLIDTVGNKFYAEYLIKNDFNDTYVTKNEMNSAINQSAGAIELSVNQKLENYSTTEEMNASINVKAKEIDQKVSKKVDGSDYTSAQILLKINNDNSEAKIKADKISLQGKTLNLSDNMEIKSNNFNVSSDGTMSCKNAQISGTISNGGDPTLGKDGAKIDSSGNIVCKDLRVYDNADSHSGLRIIPSSTSNHNNTIRMQILNDGIEVQNQATNPYTDLIHIGVFTNSGKPYIDLENSGLFNAPGGKIQTQDINATGYGYFGSYVSGESIINRSEQKLKKNILKLVEKIKNNENETAIQIIQNADIYEFNYLNQKEKTIGLVIGENYNTPQELIKTYVDENGNESKGIDLYSMISIAYKAIQEIEDDRKKDKLIIKQLTRRIESLEAKNEKSA